MTNCLRDINEGDLGKIETVLLKHFKEFEEHVGRKYELCPGCGYLALLMFYMKEFYNETSLNHADLAEITLLALQQVIGGKVVSGTVAGDESVTQAVVRVIKNAK